MPAHKLEDQLAAVYQGVKIPPKERTTIEAGLNAEMVERDKDRAKTAKLWSKRLAQLANEREKLLKAYYAEAIPLEMFKREQARIESEIRHAEGQLTSRASRPKRPRN